MADLLGYRNWAVTSSGDIVSTSAVEVRTAGGGLATLFEDAAGTMGLANPFTAETDGSFKFFADPAPYNLLVGSGPSQENIPINLQWVQENAGWSPVVADASSGGNEATAATSFGQFVKYGRMVHVNCRLLNIDTTGLTGSNSVFITGLPFQSPGNSNYRFYGSVQTDDVTFTGSVIVIMLPSVTHVNIFDNVSGPSGSNVQVQDLDSGSADISFTLMYETAE